MTVGVKLLPVALAPRRSPVLDLETTARLAGVHPELVRRLLRLGLVEPAGGTDRAPLFAPEAPARLARAVRLRDDLGVGYSGAVLACQLLDRIEKLEVRLRRYERGSPWSSTS